MGGVKFKLIIFFTVTLSSILSAQNWVKVSEIDSSDVYAITLHNDLLFAITAKKVYKKDNSGYWQPAGSFPVSPDDYSSILSYRNSLYIGTSGSGIYKSDDDGNNWQSFSANLSGWAKNISVFDAIGDSLYAGTNGGGIYAFNLTTGTNWMPINNGLKEMSVNCIYAGSKSIFTGVALSYYRKLRNENTWQYIEPDTSYWQLGVYKLYLFDNYMFAGTHKGVFRSSDDGLNWEKKDIAGFPNQDILSLTSYKSKLFAGLLYHNQHWIFSSTNYGESWDIEAHEFTWLWDMKAFDDKLWAARGDGLWYRDIDTGTDVKEPENDLPEDFNLLQNYPNPFNPETNISYSIPGDSQVTLKVYNTLGEYVATLVNEFQQRGEYTKTFSAANLPGGVYFYRLKSGEFTKTGKMILIK